MTTYVLGAGASAHAGYPLASQLWRRLVSWVISNKTEFKTTVDTIVSLGGPVADVEAVLTDLDRGRGAFASLDTDARAEITGGFRGAVAAYFTHIRETGCGASLYAAFAELLPRGDVTITFNYDVALEGELVKKHKFGVRDGYGFEVKWSEEASQSKVLNLHGSVNWIPLVWNGAKGPTVAPTNFGDCPFVDNNDEALPGYRKRVLAEDFRGGQVGPGSTTLVLPTHEKRYSVSTSEGEEWVKFYDSLFEKAAGALCQADRIVLIGYSMPMADRRARSILLWHMNKSAEIVLCCGSSNSSLAREFENHGFWRVTEGGRFEDYLKRYGLGLAAATARS